MMHTRDGGARTSDEKHTSNSSTRVVAVYAGIIYAVAAPGLQPYSLLLGYGIYCVHVLTGRYGVAAAHCAATWLTKSGRFQEAIVQHERSYRFFSSHAWVDRFRWITLMSLSSVSYREMALINITFCYGQLGNGALMKQYYRRALREFPDSSSARTCLAMVDAIERAAADTCHAHSRCESEQSYAP